MKNILVELSSVPAAADCDVLVLGGSFAGASCALHLAKSGKKVVLAEPGTFPGREMSSSLRYWASQNSLDSAPPACRDWLKSGTPPGSWGDEFPVRPDLLKIAIEDSLLEAGVKLFYSSSPAGILGSNGAIRGAVLAGKWGLQAVTADVVVDATDWASLARLAGANLLQPSYPAAATGYGTMEFMGAAANASGPVKIPGDIPVVGGTALIHRGSQGPGHCLLEFGIADRLESGSFDSRQKMETRFRRSAEYVCRFLRSGNPVFPDSRVTALSLRLSLASPWRLPASESPFVVSGFPGLFVLGSSSGFTDEQYRLAMLNPVPASRAGEQLADYLLAYEPSPHSGEPVAVLSPVEQGDYSDIFRISPENTGATRQVPGRNSLVPVKMTSAVLVAGGGTSGAVAAAASAAAGAATVLLDMNIGLGGTGTLGGVDSYWFGRRVGFTAELDQRYAGKEAVFGKPNDGKWNIEARMQALLEWNSEKGVDVFLDCTVAGTVTDGKIVKGVLAATPDGLQSFLATATVDATGDGDVAAHAGAEFTYGTVRDGFPMWYSLGLLEEPGKPQNNFTSTVDVGNSSDYTRAILAGRRRGSGHDHAFYLAPRESRHVRGDLVCDIESLLLLRKHPDTVCIGFSNCDIKGMSSSDHVAWGILPPNSEFEIPLGALLPASLEGLIVAGKAYSCTHDFLATARMQADLQNLGGAAGLAAALAVKQDGFFRRVNVRELQDQLIAQGALPGNFHSRPFHSPVPLQPEVHQIVSALTGKEPLFIDEGFSPAIREPLVVARLMALEYPAISVLFEEFRKTSGEKKRLLARLIAWHGGNDGNEYLASTIKTWLAGDTLPPIERNFEWAGTPPDHGVMPEPCYILRAMGMTYDYGVIPLLQMVADRLSPSTDDFADRKKGIFSYVETVCAVAERLGCPEAIAPLERLRSIPSLQGLSSTGFEPDFYLERRAYLELCIGRALARCGSVEGVRILESYLKDSRSILAKHARSELAVVKGGGPHPYAPHGRSV
jgi:flavin-dependent dehydrogenase